MVLSILSAPVVGANTSIDVDVERVADKTYVVDTAFAVNVPASIAWEVLTDDAGKTRPAMPGSVKKLLDDVRNEIRARAAR